MFARINHMAMISSDYPLLERYYRSLFGFVNSKQNDAEASTVVGDGNVGLNILPRRDGYVGGIDHFGMVVDSMAEVEARMKKANAKAGMVKRPSYRPFAAYSAHDPDGNVFDLAEKSGENLKDVYAEQDGEDRDATFNRFAIRTVNARSDFCKLLPSQKRRRPPDVRPGHVVATNYPPGADRCQRTR